MTMIDILLVVLAVILLPLAIVSLILAIAFIVGVFKALSPKQRRKEKEEFEERAREALRKFEVLEGKSSRK